MIDFRIALKAVLGAVLICPAASSLAADVDDGDTKPAVPTMYLDLRTYYAQIPAGSLAFGFGHPSFFNAVQTLAGPNSAALSAGLPSSKSVNVDLPFTVDVTDAVSLYAGVSGSSTQFGGGGWSSFDITSWNIGFQADLYQQNGGRFPTVTLQSTITQSIPNGPLTATSFNNILEFKYALDKDETRGLLAGVQHTRVDVGNALVRVRPNTIGYLGGYYQWPSNWKFTGRFGVQSFEGAQLLNLAPIQPFTQPIVRLDLDRMDDNDNRLFGVTAEIMWVPKPAYQLTLRTPLYAVRNSQPLPDR
ncbi:hypothetical protein QA640_12325 [Bradyrhizobium sp. CB82]|uniref:hypothetical protein n=1 Tax=Bradyrhizobium sp. CB82 TaxID=3039159 RepID=UPI0024B272F2|nr:hypothetical protein [Bradyrhizobium sp. CB82]WFU43160.1 hypothetical protein QA640_12325 [Bradyrhizobium sp. CB82]